jgi:ABC-type transport system involved in multi-copper enzyme maturation permease subunit
MNATSPQSRFSAIALPAPAGIWITEVLRLTRWELYLAWRRVMAKVLIILLVVFYAVVIGFIAVALTTIQNQAVNEPQQSYQCPPDATGCVTPSPEEIKQIQEQQAAQRAASIAQFSDPVTFPTSLGLAASYTRIVGLILICILAGTLVGSEYGFSTQRLAFSRGTSRLQILTAQTVALAVVSLIVAAGMLLLGTLVGLIVGPAFGATASAPSFGGWMEILKFFFAFAFSLFAYTLVALAAATLGKGTAAGIGLALGVIVLELILGGILTAVGLVLENVAHNNDLGQFLQHVPDWFLGNNVGALLGHAGQYPIGLAPAPGADLTFVRALIVSLIYCAIFFGGSYLLLSRRDVTE